VLGIVSWVFLQYFRVTGNRYFDRAEYKLSSFQRQLQACINAALTLIGLNLGIVYFVYDGALGNNAGLQAVIPNGATPYLQATP